MTDRMKQLAAIEGLTFADCVIFFDRKATPSDREKAALVEAGDEKFECDNSLISEGDDNGCYVMGWRWVSFRDTKFDKEKDESDDSDYDDNGNLRAGVDNV